MPVLRENEKTDRGRGREKGRAGRVDWRCDLRHCHEADTSGYRGLGIAINNLSPNEETKRRNREREERARVRSSRVRACTRRSFNHQAARFSSSCTWQVRSNVSDASDRAGHGHKQLRGGLAPSRCDVIKREVSCAERPSSAAPLRPPVPGEKFSSFLGPGARNIEMNRRPRDISASHGGRTYAEAPPTSYETVFTERSRAFN